MLILTSGLLFANPANKTASKTLRESPDGKIFTNREASTTGQKVHAGAMKINKAIRGNAQLRGVVISLCLPEGSSLSFGIMVNIKRNDIIQMLLQCFR